MGLLWLFSDQQSLIVFAFLHNLGTVNVGYPHFFEKPGNISPPGVAQSGRMGRKTPEMDELEHLLSKTPELLSLRQVWAKLQPLKVARKSWNPRILDRFGCLVLKGSEYNLSKLLHILWSKLQSALIARGSENFTHATKTYLMCAKIKFKNIFSYFSWNYWYFFLEHTISRFAAKVCLNFPKSPHEK